MMCVCGSGGVGRWDVIMEGFVAPERRFKLVRGNWEPLQDSEKGGDMMQAGKKHSCCVWQDPPLSPTETHHHYCLACVN